MMPTQDEKNSASLKERFEYELSSHNGTPSGNYFWYRKRKQLLELLDKNFGKLFQPTSKQTFLDLGCGQGVDLFLIQNFLQSRCPSLQYVGLDGWSKNIEACQLRKEHFRADNVEFCVADVTQPLPFQDSQIDILYCSEVVEHLLEPQILFSEIKRILKPNGYLILTTPNEPNVFQASFWFNSRRQKANAVVEELKSNPQIVSVDGTTTYLYGHISCKKNQEWDALLQQVGFSFIDNGRGAITYGSTHFFDNEWVLGIRFLLEACLDVLPRRISRPFSNQLIALYKLSEVCCGDRT